MGQKHKDRRKRRKEKQDTGGTIYTPITNNFETSLKAEAIVEVRVESPQIMEQTQHSCKISLNCYLN